MKSTSIKSLLLLSSMVLFVLFISSCVPIRQARILKDSQKVDTNVIDYPHIEKLNNLIKPNNELYIEVMSISTASQTDMNFFSTSERNMNQGIQDPSLISYTVNDSGYVRLPIVGEIKVSGITLEEAAETIENVLTNYIKMPSVRVRFVGRQVTVLGEVSRPGTYPFSKNNLNIFQAIGLAGDFAYYGNREKVMLVRYEDDVIKRVMLDLTDTEITQSQFYYIQEDDIIYIEPLAKRKWGFQTFPFDLLLATITSVTIVWSLTR